MLARDPLRQYRGAGETAAQGDEPAWRRDDASAAGRDRPDGGDWRGRNDFGGRQRAAHEGADRDERHDVRAWHHVREGLDAEEGREGRRAVEGWRVHEGRGDLEEQGACKGTSQRGKAQSSLTFGGGP